MRDRGTGRWSGLCSQGLTQLPESVAWLQVASGIVLDSAWNRTASVCLVLPPETLSLASSQAPRGVTSPGGSPG